MKQYVSLKTPWYPVTILTWYWMIETRYCSWFGTGYDPVVHRYTYLTGCTRYPSPTYIIVQGSVTNEFILSSKNLGPTLLHKCVVPPIHRKMSESIIIITIHTLQDFMCLIHSSTTSTIMFDDILLFFSIFLVLGHLQSVSSGWFPSPLSVRV